MEIYATDCEVGDGRKQVTWLEHCCISEEYQVLPISVSVLAVWSLNKSGSLMCSVLL